jgi:hypothetical protein
VFNFSKQDRLKMIDLFNDFCDRVKFEVTKIVENIYLVSSVVFFLSLVVGICFYMYVNQWSLPLSYYFAASVLLGDMYLVPTEPTSSSQVFTLIYFLWGTTLLAGAVAATANTLISHAGKVAADERKRILQLQNTISNRASSKRNGRHDDKAEFIESLHGRSPRFIHLEYLIYEFLKYISWFEYRSKYIGILSLLFWIVVGVIYGLYFEQWDFFLRMIILLEEEPRLMECR